MTLLQRALVIALVLILNDDLASGEIYFNEGSPQVKLSNNAILSGNVDYSREGRPFHSFHGIPYGAVPERFQEAQPAPAWKGILDATKPGNICVQISFDPENSTPHGEEDCLVLNVFVPMNITQSTEGLPVMLFIHGGGFAAGYGHEYEPHYFMVEDVILITINYRLSVFGFLSTGDSVVPGNNALKDLVLGLHWIQDNIKAFGGDPEKVTIFGESAGAALVHYLLLSPTTEGLFHRAISQSGTALGPWAYNHNPRAVAVKLATNLKCPTSAREASDISSEEIVACMKGIDANELATAATTLYESWPPGSLDFLLDFGPVAESKDTETPILTDSPWKLIFDDSIPHKGIPWIVGVTKDEGVTNVGPFISDETLFPELESKWDHVVTRMNVLDRCISSPEEATIIADKIRQFYFGEEPITNESLQSLTDMFSDGWFVHGARAAALGTARKGYPVYLYQYAHPSPELMRSYFGPTVKEWLLETVPHGQDLFTLFQVKSWFPETDEETDGSAKDRHFSQNFIKLWVAFAVHGKPSYPWRTAKEEWRPISKNELDGSTPLLWYRLTSSPQYIDEGQWKKQDALAFWDKLYKDHFIQTLFSSTYTSRSSYQDGRKIEL